MLKTFFLTAQKYRFFTVVASLQHLIFVAKRSVAKLQHGYFQ